MPKEILSEELKLLVESDEAYALIDVREKNEYESGQIFGATQVSRSLLESRIAQFVPIASTKVVLYDDDGSRALLAAYSLERYGYTNVFYLQGGLSTWVQAGFPLVEGVHVLSKSFGEIVGDLRKIVPTILPQDLQPRLAANPDNYIVIEVRPSGEVQKTGSIPGAINIPGVELPLRITDYVKSGKTIITTCAGRTRGFIACATLKMMGVDNVYDLNNGTLGWQLAGFDLQQGIPQGPMPSVDSRKRADDFAANLAKEQGLELVSIEKFDALRSKADTETLYVLDVRSLDEYNYIGHIPGSIAIPGGQAIQNTDDTIAVNNANIVFVCDNGTRSAITANWYTQMGFANVFVLDGGLSTWTNSGRLLERGVAKSQPLGYSEATNVVEKITVASMKKIINESPKFVLIDVSDSKSFAAGHIPGAKWVPRGRLEMRIGDVVADKTLPVVVTGNDGFNPTLVAQTMLELGYQNVYALSDGNKSWQDAGYDIAYGLEGIEPDDWHVHLTEYGYDEAVKYFAWEESLVHLPEYMDYFRRKGILKD